MRHSEKIKRELLNDKAFQAMFAGAKPEDKAKFEGLLENMLHLADTALDGITARVNDPSISEKDVEAAISDRTGRK